MTIDVEQPPALARGPSVSETTAEALDAMSVGAPAPEAAPPQKRKSGEVSQDMARAARARLAEVQANGAATASAPATEPPSTAVNRFRSAAKVAAASTTAARMHRTRRLSAGDAATHTIAEDECIAFIDFINARLEDDAQLAHLLPIESIESLWGAVGDGLLLCKLINIAAPETIDARALNLPKNGAITPFHTVENLNLALNAARGIGIKVVNVGSQDMVEGKPHLVLGLLWQVVKMSLLSKISLKENPFLIRLLQPGEALEDLLKLTPEELLTRWVNHHLEASGTPRRLHNFGPDLRDSEIYAHLLSQIDPEGKCKTGVLRETADPLRRAEYVVEHGARLQSEFLLRPVDVVKANEKLNLGFLAALFNACPGLDPPDEAELKLFDELEEDDVGDSREERAFRAWINSLGLENAHCGNLFEDVRDGVLLLKTMDRVQPGSVDWSKASLKQPIKLVFRKVENCNYAIDLATSAAFKYSLVGVQGKDIVDGNRKLTLALIWQLMRTHLALFLASLRGGAKGGGEATMSDAEMLRWATHRVAASGRATTMRDFADKSLASGLFWLDLLAAVEPRCVNRELITAGSTEEERMLNARYAVACARKLGCAIFCLPEDLVDVRPKMTLAFVASVMAVDLQQQKAPASSAASAE